MNGFFEFIESINLLILFCGTGKKKKKNNKSDEFNFYDRTADVYAFIGELKEYGNLWK